MGRQVSENRQALGCDVADNGNQSGALHFPGVARLVRCRFRGAQFCVRRAGIVARAVAARHTGSMGIWVGVVVIVVLLGVVVLWVTRGGKAGRVERMEWRQLQRAGRRELRQHRRENGRRVSGAEIARQRGMQADQLPFSMPDGG